MPDPKPAPQMNRPRVYPPPEFPPRRPALFARMPPAVFPVLMGALGLGLALRRGLPALGLPAEIGEMVLGAAVALWLFAAFGYLVKLTRRPSVLFEDLRVLPGRAGLAAGSLGLLLTSVAILPYVPAMAQGLLFAGLGLHAALAAALIYSFATGPAEAREVTPAWHLHFVGFIIGGLSAAPLGLIGLSLLIFAATGLAALAIWAVSLWQLFRRIPPAPLRPLLAIHLSPACLLSGVASLLGLNDWALAFLAVSGAIFLALVGAARWITVSGFSPMWGAFTFPLAAFASALFLQGFDVTGTIVLVLALGLVPLVLFRVLKAWAGGSLAARTNAAEA